MEELDKRISEIVRSKVKEFMESLLKGRDIGTRYGKINGLRVQ
jgi:tetrahydromethanopterin S-methyltransferase subunit G